MALVLKDRVRESSTSSGTGSITLAGAYTGYQTFASAVASGSTVYYTIRNTTAGNDGEWEVGVGTFTSPSTLSRDTVFSSSTGGSKVSFSGSSVLEVFITQPAEQAVYINDATGKVEIFGNGTNVVAFTEINTTNLTANTVTLTAGTISTNAANATDITNKQYVDGLFSTGISYHDPVLVESPTNLVAVYNQPNGAGNGVGATLTNSGSNVALVIDGVSLSNTARVLVYTQSNAVQNGIYTVTNPGAPDSPGPGAQWVLTRATDADTYGLADPNALGAGDAVFVQQGNTGAGETYVCNTPGTITFGTTNITFAQISSAQIYSAGTGLNLSNLTFSISNTTVTAATYGNDGNVAQITVNAQGQLTNASNVAINASSITVGTLANARTTASDANGASTIVSRDANGSFAANVGTFTTVNATSGNFTNITGNAVALTDINASNITSGTISNARTTGSTSNSSSTLVLRDSNGSFGANVVSAASFSGDGTAITAINASNISSGTIANARTTAASANGASTIVLRDASGNFEANTVNAVSLIGNASQVTAINASNISSGTIANARTTASSSNGASTIVLRGASGEFAAGAITGASFSGNGAPLTDINASNISSGTIANARTTAASANGASTIVARDAGGNFSANTITATTFNGAHSGNGSALTDINASNITSGTISNARTTAATANGASTIVLRGTSGEFSAGAITGSSFTGNGAAISAINASNISTGTIDNARTTASSANGANTIVLRDASGDFSVDGITANWLTGNGANLSAINASNISTGTIANARTTASDANGASTIVSRDANGSFSANVITAGAISGNGSSLTAINASNISSGTIANARTTASAANGASTIVLRDANGDFAADAITANFFIGDGSNVSAINASNISSGTVNTARISGSYTGITGVGTLTAGTWNANVVSAQYGGTGSANLTAENVILGNGASAVKVVAPGTANNVLTSNGTTWISQAPAAAGGFAAGTRLIFAQTSAPTGWTKDTVNYNNHALRVVTGTASTGGTVDFTTAFASQAVSGSVSTTVNNTTATNQAATATNQATTATNQAATPAGTVSISAITGSAGATTLGVPEIPSHSHPMTITFNENSGGTNFVGGAGGFARTNFTNAAGGGGSHTHPFSFSSGTASFSGSSLSVLQNSHNHTQDAHNHTQDAHNHTASSSFTGTAINLAVKYLDVITATKD